MKPEERMDLTAICSHLKNVFKFKKHDIKKAAEKKVFWKQLLENDKQHDEEVMEVNVQEEELVQMMAKQKFGFDEKDEIIKEIRTITPLEDFKKMINEKRMDLVETALFQIQKIIISLIRDSVRQNFFDKAMECIKEMRKACISEDEPDKFNAFLTSMKMNVMYLTYSLFA